MFRELGGARLPLCQIEFCPLVFQANNATLNAHIGPMVKAAKSVATVRMEAVVTTFQELVLARPDGEELCKCTTYTYVRLWLFHCKVCV